MKLCFITPFKHMKYTNKGGAVFGLIKEAVENAQYRKYLKQQVKKGIDVYLDANIHEQERQKINLDEAMEIILKEKLCSIIIIPDRMFLTLQTLVEVDMFLKKYYIRCKEANMEIMAVCQGRHIEELFFCFKKLLVNKKIDRVGVPFDNSFISVDNNSYLNQALSRLYFLQKISKLHPQKKIHCLGCNSVLEVVFASHFPFVCSLDTKLFSRVAMGEITLDKNNWLYVTKPKKKMTFQTVFTLKQEQIFKKNLNFVMKLIC